MHRAVAVHPLSVELHYLHAVLLHALGRDTEAAQAARRTLFLDPTLVMSHYLLGSIEQRRGRIDAARRSFRNAYDRAIAHPRTEVLALSDGEIAGRLAQAAARQLDRLDHTATEFESPS